MVATFVTIYKRGKHTWRETEKEKKSKEKNERTKQTVLEKKKEKIVKK